MKKNQNNFTIPKDNAFMVPSNSAYKEFYSRFFDKNNTKKQLIITI